MHNRILLFNKMKNFKENKYENAREVTYNYFTLSQNGSNIHIQESLSISI